MNLVKTQIPTSCCVLEKSSLLVICLATIGVAFFGALTSVGAPFYFLGGKKMKKLLSLMLILVTLFSLVACGNNTSSKGELASNPSATTKELASNPSATTKELIIENSQATFEIDSLESLEEMINSDVENTISALSKNFEDLKTKIDTYEKYKSNTAEIEVFYNETYASHEALTIRLREYALAYAETILKSEIDNDDKYDEMDELYDVIYDGAGDDLYDEIYDGILDDIYDVYYDGILDDAYDTVQYSEWSDLRSDEYDWWSDTRSDIYDDWSDFRSDVYDFWSDIRSDLWDDDLENANERVEKFKKDVNKLKSN